MTAPPWAVLCWGLLPFKRVFSFPLLPNSCSYDVMWSLGLVLYYYKVLTYNIKCIEAIAAVIWCYTNKIQSSWIKLNRTELTLLSLPAFSAFHELFFFFIIVTTEDLSGLNSLPYSVSLINKNMFEQCFSSSCSSSSSSSATSCLQLPPLPLSLGPPAHPKL